MNQPPVSAPISYPAPVSAPVSIPQPYDRYVVEWKEMSKNVGYPRPQGKLSNFRWGLVAEQKQYLNDMYNKI